jgi:FkbM family methyltransferase
MSFVTHLIKTGLQKAGYELHKRHLSPMGKLLGAANLPVHSILDIGANEGQFAQLVSSYFPQATIYCFEPVPQPFSTLKSWAARQTGRVVPVNCAIGDAPGCFDLIRHDSHTSSSSFLRTTAQCERYYPQTKEQSAISVVCETLDGAVNKLGEALRDDILIKVDVQGYEDRVIRGGQETFRKSTVAILEVSLVPLYESQPTFAQIVGLMDKLDFNYGGSLDQTCKADGRLLSIDAVFFKRR